MKVAQYVSLGTVPAFTLTDYSDPMTWLARDAAESIGTRANMVAQGMAITEPEEADYTAVETAFDSLSTDIKAWFDGAVNASSEGTAPTAFDPENLPDIVTFIALLATQNWGAIFLLFVKVGLRAVLDISRKKLDPATSTGDMVEFLKQTIAVLDDDGNVVGCRLEGLSNLQVEVKNILSQGESDALYSIKAMQE